MAISHLAWTSNEEHAIQFHTKIVSLLYSMKDITQLEQLFYLDGQLIKVYKAGQYIYESINNYIWRIEIETIYRIFWM